MKLVIKNKNGYFIYTYLKRKIKGWGKSGWGKNCWGCSGNIPGDNVECTNWNDSNFVINRDKFNSLSFF